MAVPEHEASLEFPAAPQSAGDARRFVRTCLDKWDVHVAGDDVVLLVSELVTNVGLHARTEASVRLTVHHDCLRVEVTDGSTEPVQRRPHTSGAETGRGLMIVDALAASWGVEPLADGKTVWFEVPVTSARRAAAPETVE